jgi:tRNA1Val (adenine37-N6)-methyltransferase
MGRRNTTFRFKQFSIDHSGATMKVGTDAVLLGAWAKVDDARDLLDIGTGSGVIALMLAQRTMPHAHIDAVEISEGDAAQARHNVLNSPWPKKVDIHCTPIQEFNPGKKYDCIVSNPPYFINSYLPPDQRRTASRHTVSLSFHDLLDNTISLLKSSGTFNVILPETEGNEFIDLSRTKGLHPSRRCRFFAREGKAVERILLEFRTDMNECEETTLIHYSVGEEWTEEYKRLTRDFYLRL